MRVVELVRMPRCVTAQEQLLCVFWAENGILAKKSLFWPKIPNKSLTTPEPQVRSTWGKERWMRASELERMPNESGRFLKRAVRSGSKSVFLRKNHSNGQNSTIVSRIELGSGAIGARARGGESDPLCVCRRVTTAALFGEK